MRGPNHVCARAQRLGAKVAERTAKYFSSSATNKVDAKGRVSIPALFRKVLAAEASPVLFLMPEVRGKPAIEGFGETYFAQLHEQLGELNPLSDEYDALTDLLVSSTVQLPLDETGRIVLPASLREAANIEGEALFVGRSRTFQIWRPDAYEALKADMRQTARASFGKLPGGKGAKE